MTATLQNMLLPFEVKDLGYLEAEVIKLKTRLICIGAKIQEVKTKYSLP
jgi:hypothetical protein